MAVDAKSKLFIVGVFVFGFITAIVLIYTFGNFVREEEITAFENELSLARVPDVERLATQNQSVDELEDWKIYRDEFYNFEFLYPSGWLLEDNEDGYKYEGLSIASPFRVLERESNRDIPPAEISLSILRNPEGLDLGAFVEQFENGWFSAYSGNKSFIIGGQKAWRFSDANVQVGHAPFEAVFIESSPEVLFFAINDYPSINSGEQLKVFDQILSTFKFTDAP